MTEPIQGLYEGGDDVQRSLELLDRVLSEFDDIENANQVQQQQQQQLVSSATTTNDSGRGGDGHEASEAKNKKKADVAVVVNGTTIGTAGPGNTGSSSTPDDDSPSLGGHQSEDDGYMSMNGRKAKFALSFNTVNEVIIPPPDIPPPLGQNSAVPPPPVATITGHQGKATGDVDFPPPPEEAERLIATLLPRVSPGNSTKRSVGRRKNNKPQHPANKTRIEIENLSSDSLAKLGYVVNGDSITATTQTTLPKTRHQRPYGWEKNEPGFHLHPQGIQMGNRYASLPYDSRNTPQPTWVPPRTIPGAADRHREVCRRRMGSEENLANDEENPLRPLSELADDEHFSDDSLEEVLPPPPPPSCSKRSSIAWEVSIGDEDPLLTPGSTKVVRRRRRKSGDQSQSSTSSIPNRLRELDDWPDPPPCSTEDEIVSPFSDSDDPVILPDEIQSSDLSNSGTYVIRRGRKDRRPLQNVSMSPNSNLSLNSRLSSDLSIPHSRFSGGDWNNSYISRELQTPSSRVSIDLSIPSELNSPKSRYSLDLNHSSSSRRSSEPNHSRSITPNRYNEIKKHSTTFDNFKSLIKEGAVENYSPPTVETITNSTSIYNEQNSPNLVRVVSLPTLSAEEYTPRRELAVTVEEEEDIESPRQNSANMSPLRQIEKNISNIIERADIDVSRLQLEEDKLKHRNTGVRISINSDDQNSSHIHYNYIPKYNEIQKSNSNVEIRKSDEYYRQIKYEERKRTGEIPAKPKRNGIQKSESAKEMLLVHHPETGESWPLPNSNSVDFPVRVEVLQHEFPPLPPSPVEEDEDEYQEILHPAQKTRADTLPSSSDPPAIPPHRDPVTNSLKTRSVDAEFTRGHRHINYSGRQSSAERRTLPTELPGTRRRTFLKRSSQSPREEHHHHHHHMQTSCSLPETPIFARGCDIPRTPHRRAPDVPGVGSRTAPRQSNTMNSITPLGTTNSTTNTAYRRGISSSGLEQAMVGAELLRLAGGPGRGWYPRHRHPRPASIEHLDRLAPGHINPWDNSKKPLTLPPNLTPKFYQRSPREALRRVTSLLIRKGNNKESKKDRDVLSPSGHSVNGEEGPKKKGFFKSFWKRSRHYSLEQ